MKNILSVLALFTALIVGAPVLAASPSSVLGTCLVDHLNGKERKDLAKWIFFSIAAHPEIKPYSNASAKDIEESDRYVGRLLTRLLAEDCPKELRNAGSADPQAVAQAFKLVGQVAMQEIMTNPAVKKSLTNYVRYADVEKIKKVIKEK